MRNIAKAISPIRSFFLRYRLAYPVGFASMSCLVLSWIYALCEQTAVPLPFNPVPIIVLQVVLFTLGITIGWHAVWAYGAYLMQGALGAPFFAHGFGGFAHLAGPTGGYLLGMGLAVAFLAATRNVFKNSPWALLGKILVAHMLEFGLGLAQLSFFVPRSALLACGFWPFVIGDFVIKTGCIMLLVRAHSSYAEYR